MLSKLRKSESGFTLIELLIVVAIIGILAAIAIPQFSQYRVRGYNTAANADIKNFRMTEEALFGDFQTYGHSAVDTANTLPAITVNLAGVANPYNVIAGATVTGPVTGATSSTGGGYIAGAREPDGAPVAGSFGLSNRVSLTCSTLASSTGGAGMGSYLAQAKHTQADRVFATESDNTAIFFVQKGAWINTTLATAAGLAVPAQTIANDFGTSAAPVAGGGEAPNANWTAL